MCGIAGIVTLDGRPADPEAVRRMTRRLAHRGPDGEGVAVFGPAAIGNRRLAILDLSDAGTQPMTDASGRYTITFNGEIYNYLELRTELESLGSRFRSASDTEVLLEGFARWGTAVLPRLNGMFAFAVWDQAERTLFAARDRFGERPFYFEMRAGREFRFASEIKALAPPGSGAGRPRPEMIFRFLAYGHAGDRSATFFAGIDQLPAAHCLTLRGNALSVSPYWSLPDRTLSTLGGDEAAEALRALVADSVRLRLRSDVPVGTSLSGGLDSSVVVAEVARQFRAADSTETQAAFSACFPGTPVDESRYVQSVVAATGVTSHCVYPTADALAAELPDLVAAQDEPIGGPSVFAQWKVMQLARSNSVTVLLDGQGADEVFGGYPFFFGDLWFSLLARGRVAEFARDRAAYDAVHGRGAARGLLLPAGRQRLRAAVHDVAPDVPWLTPDFGRAGAVPPPRPARSLRESLRHAQVDRMLPHLLRYADRNSMAFSREVRLPFLDHRLVEFVDALPDEMKLRGGVTKLVLRQAAAALVPAEVTGRRDKIGFAVPVVDWMRGPLREIVQDVLGSAAIKERGVFAPGAVAATLRNFLAGDDGESSSLWRLFAAELWMRAYVGGGQAPA